MADEKQQVAAERTVVKNPLMDDPNAGIIVAAGDPIPAGVGVISNTPNKVDAAANYDEADAADKAGAGARPATRVVSGGTGPDPEIVARVEGNRDAWNEQSAALGDQAASPADNPASDASPSTTAPGDMTVAELDAAYGDVDGYPRSGNKADKVAFAEAR